MKRNSKIKIAGISIKWKLILLFIAAMSVLIIMNIVSLKNEKNYIAQYNMLIEKLSIETSYNSQAEQTKGVLGILQSTRGQDKAALEAYDNIKKEMLIGLEYLDKNVKDEKSKSELLGLHSVVQTFISRGDNVIKYSQNLRIHILNLFRAQILLRIMRHH